MGRGSCAHLLGLVGDAAERVAVGRQPRLPFGWGLLGPGVAGRMGGQAAAQGTQPHLPEMEGVEETVLATWLEKGRLIPEPVVRLEMPERLFDRLPNKEELLSFVLSD
jgi:hypothetical protein